MQTQDQVDDTEIGDALEKGRKDLVNPTMKDYAARIYTFVGPKYLGEMFTDSRLIGIDPVLFTYETIELILATFKTGDAGGQIVKQRVNVRAVLRKRNEFKQTTENRESYQKFSFDTMKRKQGGDCRGQLVFQSSYSKKR